MNTNEPGLDLRHDVVRGAELGRPGAACRDHVDRLPARPQSAAADGEPLHRAVAQLPPLLRVAHVLEVALVALHPTIRDPVQRPQAVARARASPGATPQRSWPRSPRSAPRSAGRARHRSPPLPPTSPRPRAAARPAGGRRARPAARLDRPGDLRGDQHVIDAAVQHHLRLAIFATQTPPAPASISSRATAGSSPSSGVAGPGRRRAAPCIADVALEHVEVHDEARRVEVVDVGGVHLAGT